VGLLRNREFAGVLLGTGVSVIGDQLARVALVILVYHRTDSPLLSSATYAATFIPVVVGTPLLGGLADRLPRRLVVISTDLVRAALFALMAIPGMPVWGVLVLLVVAVTAEAPWNAARGALMRDVVGSDEEYQLGTSLDETVYLGGQILGFALSGILLVVITPSTALLLDAVTFVVAGIIVRAVVSDRPASDPAAGTDPASATRSASRVARWTGRLRQGVADARLGLRVALAPGPRRPLLLTWTGISLAIAPEALAVAWVDQIHGGSLGVGLMYSTAPLGSVVGMLFVARLPVERGQHLLLPLAVLSLLPLLAAPVAQHLPWALALVFLSGVGTSYSMLARVAFVRRLDNAHRGRAYSIAAAGVTAGQGLGIALAGSAASLTDPALAVCLTAGLGLLLVAWVEVAAREPRGSLSGPAETA
jgi:MFS family permease